MNWWITTNSLAFIPTLQISDIYSRNLLWVVFLELSLHDLTLPTWFQGMEVNLYRKVYTFRPWSRTDHESVIYRVNTKI